MGLCLAKKILCLGFEPWVSLSEKREETQGCIGKCEVSANKKASLYLNKNECFAIICFVLYKKEYLIKRILEYLSNYSEIIKIMK